MSELFGQKNSHFTNRQRIIDQWEHYIPVYKETIYKIFAKVYSCIMFNDNILQLLHNF